MRHLFFLVSACAALVLPATAAIVPAAPVRLSNGLMMVLRPDRSAPQVSYSVLLRTGASDESPDTAGWRRLAVNAVLQGESSAADPDDAGDATSLARAALKAGGTIGATVGDDFVEFYASGESSHRQELLQLILDVVDHPKLSDSDINSARQKLLDQVTSGSGDPSVRTQEALRSRMYRDARGELVAYGLSDFGTSESLHALTDDKVRQLVKDRLQKARIIVGVAGDLDEEGVRQTLEAVPSTHNALPAVPFIAAVKPSQPALIVREFPTPAAWIFVTYPLLNAPASDLPALRVMTAALSDSSRALLPAKLLAKNLINDPNAAVSVAAQFTSRRYACELTVFAQAGPQGVDHIKNVLLQEMNKLKDQELTAAQLQSAKNYLRGEWSVERESLRARAFHAALPTVLTAQADTSWPRSVQNVTAADLTRVAKKYLNNYAVALIMPQN